MFFVAFMVSVFYSFVWRVLAASLFFLVKSVWSGLGVGEMLKMYLDVTFPALDEYFAALSSSASSTASSLMPGNGALSSAGADLFWLLYSLFPFRFLTIVWMLTLIVGLDFFTKQTTFRLAWNRMTGGFMLFLTKPSFNARPGVCNSDACVQFEAKGNARPTSVLQFDFQLASYFRLEEWINEDEIAAAKAREAELERRKARGQIAASSSSSSSSGMNGVNVNGGSSSSSSGSRRGSKEQVSMRKPTNLPMQGVAQAG
jgi:hypothetical protein